MAQQLWSNSTNNHQKNNKTKAFISGKRFWKNILTGYLFKTINKVGNIYIYFYKLVITGERDTSINCHSK